MKDRDGVYYLNAKLPVDFSIEISSGVFDTSNKELLYFGYQGPSARRIVVIDLKVSKLYLDDIKKYFKFYDVHCSVIIINAIEENKNIY